METSTCDAPIRHGKEWFENCTVRAIVFWTRRGGIEIRPHAPPGWCVKLRIWPWFRAISGKYEYFPEHESVEACFPIDAENYRRAVKWLAATVPARYAVQINYNEIKDVFQRIQPEQQRRIVEILYQRYPI